MKLVSLVVAFLFTISAPAQDAGVLAARVTSVVDGDTIDVQVESGPVRVRFDSIDAPELRQPWGPEATEALSRRLGGVGAEVELAVREELSTGELVATVYVGGDDVNSWLVEQGHAWVYRADPRGSLPALQYQARLAGRGLWSLAKPVEPWKWVRARFGDQIF
jgi:endonuclease YncB( thermonuclease family)